MNPFWSVSLFWGATVVCVAIALAFILPALLRGRAGVGKAARRDINIAVYRDQMKDLEADRANGLLPEAQYEAAKLELEARLAEDALSDEAPEPGRIGSRGLGYTLAAALPVAAFGLYFWLGNPASLAEAKTAAAHPDMAAETGEHDFMKMVQKVEDKTRANPDDGEAWSMLAKTYAAMEQWTKALPAYEQAIRLLPQDASVLSGYAEALAVTNNRVLVGKPMELIQKALEIDANDMKGLELAGIQAYQDENFAQASYYFKRLYKLMPPESPYAQDILAAQKEADRLVQAGLSGLDSLAGPAAGTDKPAPVVSGASIKGSVDIAPALKSRLADTDVLFLFARPESGGPPVAAIRASAGKLPLAFELDDSMAMNPANTLSKHKQVTLVARVSKSGNPTGQPGDLEGMVADVKVGATGVNILIDQPRP